MANVSPLQRRLSLAQVPTPVEPLDRLAAALGKPPSSLWVKRDDLTALGGGGNKARKLDYLCADALTIGADTLVTGGGPQSNHVRMTAAAANRLGLACTVVIAGARPDVPTGNLVLDALLGADVEWYGGEAEGEGELPYAELEAAIGACAEGLRAAGRRPYAIPIGGATAIGALGYVHAAQELPPCDLVVVADGSGGTHAGLAAGLGDHGRVLGVDVGARPDVAAAVASLAVQAAGLAGLEPPTGDVNVDHSQTGPAYGVPTEAAREAVVLAARLEGLILDPVYTGKAMAGLIAACREERIDLTANVVFLHTGGLPALFAASYAGWIGPD